MSDARTEPVLKAALAHLWFVTIHPFDDGNGRIARGIADMALARSEGTSRRFYSMSGQIHEERDGYYRMLEQTQQGTMDVTPWMDWFLGCLTRAIEGAQAPLAGVIQRARYWERLRDAPADHSIRADPPPNAAVRFRVGRWGAGGSLSECSPIMWRRRPYARRGLHAAFGSSEKQRHHPRSG